MTIKMAFTTTMIILMVMKVAITLKLTIML